MTHVCICLIVNINGAQDLEKVQEVVDEPPELGQCENAPLVRDSRCRSQTGIATLLEDDGKDFRHVHHRVWQCHCVAGSVVTHAHWINDHERSASSKRNKIQE